jgi:hypothetical protein
MREHTTRVKRSGEGVIGTCSCRQKQRTPVPTVQEAEDWIEAHLREVIRTQARLAKPMTPPAYLAYLREMEADTTRSAAERALWRQLAEEHERRAPVVVEKGDLRPSPNVKYNTGVETEPLF